jgi:hypothetical protein
MDSIIKNSQDLRFQQHPEDALMPGIVIWPTRTASLSNQDLNAMKKVL